jgi:hypothetical protein
MGGLALAHCTRRFEAGEYYEVADQALQILERLYPCAKVRVIKAYRDKPSFGDLDILIESEYLQPFWIDRVSEAFNSKDSTKNGNVLSIEFREMQVDIIATKSDEFESSYQYFNYNDLGNLVGRVAHSMGLKLGHDGLTYKFMGAERYVFKEIKLLDDWEDVLPVLGYDWNRYKQGFDTLEDLFEFVVSSPFFNKAIYALENRNHAARTRDSKRKTYMEFLTWLEDYEETDIQLGAKYADRLDYIGNKVPSFWEQYDATVAEFEQAQEYKKRFNGELVSQWTGLEKQELGKFMAWLKGYKEQTRWKKDVVSLNPILVEGLVKYYFEKYNETLEV